MAVSYLTIIQLYFLFFRSLENEPTTLSPSAGLQEAEYVLLLFCYCICCVFGCFQVAFDVKVK